jgi:polyisoprenoid-binding protein YceI
MVLRLFFGRHLASILFFVLFFQAVASAAAHDPIPKGKWAVLTFDVAHTTIVYNLTGWPHITHGTFKLKHGILRLDPETGQMSGAIVVDAASGNSGHSVRDGRMNNSVLEADRYPEITFVPQQVASHGQPQGEFPVSVRGIMTLHGEPHPFTIPATVKRDGDAVTLHSNFAIPYVEWGLEDPSILFFKVDKQVDIEVSAVAHLTWVSP